MPASGNAETPVGASWRILVFAKAAVAGRVKTRLIPILGAENAAALHERLLHHALSCALAARPDAIELWCSPSARHSFFRRYADRFHLCDQGRGHLGSRMARAFDEALRKSDHALAIGADCPALRPADIRTTADALSQGYDAAITPAEDGGYVMLGLAHFAPAVFKSIAWGTDNVLAQTRKRLAALGWHWREMPALWDVDRPQDYRRMLRECALPGWAPLEAAQLAADERRSENATAKPE